MNPKKSALPEGIQEFIRELSTFATLAEDALKKIETDPEGNKSLFSIFSDQMLAIRGTAQQLALPHIAHIAGLGEELSIKGTTSTSRSQIRKCMTCLWDANTTVKYLLEHYTEETNEEQAILIHRLENTLRVMGGTRQKMNSSEIEELLKQRG